MNFFALALWAHNVLLILHALSSMVAIIWSLYFRSVTNLYSTIECMRTENKSNGSLGSNGLRYGLLMLPEQNNT